MTEIRNIIHRLRLGQSIRQIHRELGVYRRLISELHTLAIKYQWLDVSVAMPNDQEIESARNNNFRNQVHPLDVYKNEIEQWNKEGLTAVVIQRLLEDKYSCDVQVIRRYRNKHFPKPKEPVMVRPTEPGKHLDVDFGYLGRFLTDDGSIKKAWLFSLRFRHSRKAYREIVLNQTIATFLIGFIHAFEYFCGVPKFCILDNLKAGVIRSTIDNDMLNRSFEELAEHYGFIISPCLPRTPEHKGGVEGDIKYVKNNFLPYFLVKQRQMGVKTPRICDLIEGIQKWDNEVANVRIISGVGRSPLDLFDSEEKKMLLPLPKERWEPTTWKRCTVRKDWRIMIDSAYYSVPYQLIDQMLRHASPIRGYVFFMIIKK